MKKNKVIKWIKKHNKVIIGSVATVALGSVYLYFLKQRNTEGTNTWFNLASLDELEVYRDKVGKEYMNSGLNNLSNKEYNELERKMYRLDKLIGKIKNKSYKGELPHREHGWYLPNKD